MAVKTNAGRFAVVSHTDGYPVFVRLTGERDNGEPFEVRFHHNELADLEYAVSRHREVLRAAVDGKTKSEI